MGKWHLGGHVFAFRGQRSNLVKLLFWDGTGLYLFTKRSDRGHFVWPRVNLPGDTIPLSPAQLAMLLEGIDRRHPERVWRPTKAG